MDQPYSVVADWLSKFQTASAPIQALWLIAGAATWLGSLFCLLRAAMEIVAHRRGRALGQPLYAIYRAPDGRLMLHVLGRVRELHPDDLPALGSMLPRKVH